MYESLDWEYLDRTPMPCLDKVRSQGGVAGGVEFIKPRGMFMGVRQETDEPFRTSAQQV
jgi:hypothetical protein